MTQQDWKSKILTRRATFFAAALATAGAAAPGCNKDKPDVMQNQPGGEASSPMVCLRATAGGPTNAAPEPELGKPVPFEIKKDADRIVGGTLSVEVEGAAVPHAARVGTGPLLLARTRSCFLEAAERGEKLEGKLDLVFELGAGGRPTSAKATNTGEITDKLRDCIAEGAKNLAFSAPAEGKPAKVTVHWVIGGE